MAVDVETYDQDIPTRLVRFFVQVLPNLEVRVFPDRDRGRFLTYDEALEMAAQKVGEQLVASD
jgi:hypothetical protein